jgi:phosphomannomutase
MEALSTGLKEGGCNTHNIGMCGTEEVYFATFHYEMDGGIMVTASHNPMDYNGVKLVEKQSKPVSGDTGLNDIHDLVETNTFSTVDSPGEDFTLDHRADYLKHLLSYIDLSKLKPLKIAVDPGNGGAGLIVQELEKHLPFEFIKVNFEPDGHFPNGIPNPLLPDRRESILNAVKEHNADLGIAWDGDFDRCFLIDENGNFIEGYYIVGMLAEAFLEKEVGAKIIHDPRLTWNTIDIVKAKEGIPVQSKTGHAFIKQRMREEDAIYGGEMSAHHYFRDFAYCDSGMIPWLLASELLCIKNISLSELVKQRMALFPCSGEINFKLADTGKILKRIENHYLVAENDYSIDRTDGLSVEFQDWRFNVRTSNTEPLLRLNVETRENTTLLDSKLKELSDLITQP